MAMIEAKKGSRDSAAKVRISKAKTITFSAGFFRKFGIDETNTKYLRQGYDKENNKIGIEFVKPEKEGESEKPLMKLSFTKAGSAASCPIRPILSMFKLDIEDISGNYEEDATGDMQSIDGFSKQGILLDVALRKAI